MKNSKIFCLLLLTCIIIALSVSLVNATDSLGKNEVEIKMELQEAGIDAYQNMMKVFDPEENFNFNYPEEYAGAYLSDDNYLVICLTDVSDDNISKYQKLCQSSSILKFQKSEYSYKELYDLARDVHRIEDAQNIVY